MSNENTTNEYGSDSYYRGEQRATGDTALNLRFRDESPFEALGVTIDASETDVQQAWRNQVISYHRAGLAGPELHEKMVLANGARDVLLHEAHRAQVNDIWGPQTVTPKPVYSTSTSTRTEQPTSTTNTTYTPRHSTYYGPDEYLYTYEQMAETYTSKFPKFTEHFTTTSSLENVIVQSEQPTTALVTLDQLTYAQLYRAILIAYAVISSTGRPITSESLNHIAGYVLNLEGSFITIVGNAL